jgi:hypothetical protein
MWVGGEDGPAGAGKASLRYSRMTRDSQMGRRGAARGPSRGLGWR